jgi:hypothetical protein
MGYYNYQQGLIYRHLNQHSGWDSHLEHCRDFILKAVDKVKPDSITVLGSGWLIELPLADLSERTKKITLIDIVHPPEVIEQSAGLRNVKLSEQDVSGGLIQEVWNKAGAKTFFNKLSSLETITIPIYEPEEDPGLVISLNILTQLEILPEKLLRKKSRARDEDFISFKKEIQEKHISFLKKQASILISDIVEVIIDAKGNKIENNTLLTGLPSARLSENWIWDFDLMHADYNLKKSQFKVAAILI